MNARTVTRLCQVCFDDIVVSYTSPSGRIVATAAHVLSKELRYRIAAVVPHFPSIDYVPPCSVGLTPEEWELVLELPATCTADSAITTTHTA